MRRENCLFSQVFLAVGGKAENDLNFIRIRKNIVDFLCGLCYTYTETFNWEVKK